MNLVEQYTTLVTEFNTALKEARALLHERAETIPLTPPPAHGPPDIAKLLHTCAVTWGIEVHETYLAISMASPSQWSARVIGRVGPENFCKTIASEVQTSEWDAIRDLEQKVSAVLSENIPR